MPVRNLGRRHWIALGNLRGRIARDKTTLGNDKVFKFVHYLILEAPAALPTLPIRAMSYRTLRAVLVSSVFLGLIPYNVMTWFISTTS
jgi:hypothetical protein